jgi:hypothetical protein
MEWKWTINGGCERSKRIYKNTSETDEDSSVFRKNIENSAYSSSLNYDENTWGLLNESLSNIGFKNSNKREDLDNKMADRDMIQQIGCNPFLPNSNYANDISNCDRFLKPVNTSEDRIKNNE